MRPFDLLANAVRAREILGVLVRNGFANLLEHVELPTGFLQRLVPRPASRLNLWQRARVAAEELGPTFVKFGQILSSRPDVAPQALILELRKLQDQVQAQPFAEVRTVLVDEMGPEWHELFSRFEEQPVASGSLAQVYFAVLRTTGQPVAVKVQRSEIQKKVEADLDILLWLAGQLHQRVSALTPFNLPGIVEEVRRGMLQELDFTHEARNQQFFNAQNPHPEEIFAPAVVEELTSRRVLVMEYVDGRRLEGAALDPAIARELAQRGARSIFHQIVIGGFFHADPHGGNVFVTADHRICLLDWGLAGHLTKRMRYALADLYHAAVTQDAEAIVSIASTLASPAAKPDWRAMERDVTLAIREHFNARIGRPETGRFIVRLIHIFGTNGISVARDYSLMAKAVLSIEDIGRSLDPQFELQQAVRPVVKELQRERFSVRGLARRSRLLLQGSILRLRDLPADLDRIVRRLESDNLTINFQHRGLEELDDALGAASNRITLAIIIAALIVGSSLIINTKIPPNLFGYPVLGIVGYLLSAVFGIWVVIDILRHGRHR